MNSKQIIIDTAVPGDRDGIIHLLEMAHGQHNPYWDELDSWLDGDGALTVVAADTEASGDGAPVQRAIVGLGRIAPLAPGEWWVESLITHDEFRRRGIMQRIFMYGYSWWLRNGSGTIRGLVSDYNTAIQEHIEKWNVGRLRSYTHYVAPVLANTGAHQFTPITEAEVDDAMAAFEGSPILAASGGIVEQRWRWRHWNRDYAVEMARAGELFRWGDGRGVAALWSRAAPGGPELRVWLAASNDLVGMARAMHAYAAEVLPALDPRPGRIHWRVPEAAGLDEALQEAGFAVRDGFENRFHVYEFTARRE
ncbi:hypothetical protein [Haliangium sp.]|uniref:hypothetical protein n=1 Tax=Haliangium sp. TaxID=2663208 RepID=UPI003D11C31E